MPDDLAHAHAARIHGNDLLVEARKASLVFGDELRIERRLPIPRDIQLDPAGLGRHRLLAIAIAAVAGLATRQMMVHLGAQRPLGERLLQIVQKAIRVKGRLRISPSQKLVKNGVGYLRYLLRQGVYVAIRWNYGLYRKQLIKLYARVY